MKEEKKDFKKAVWQYLIEHSNRTPEGYYHIDFIAKSKRKFWGKIVARKKGYKKLFKKQ